MDLVLNLFTEKELMIIGLVVGSLILIVLILTFVDILSRKKKESKELDDMFNKYDEIEVEPIKKNNLNEFENKEKLENIVVNDDKNNVEVLEEKKLDNNELLTEIIDIKENEVQVENIDIKENEEQLENIDKVEYIEPLIMDVEEDNIQYVSETNRDKAEQELLKIEEELKNPKSLEDTLYNLEIMEEENAIISYQELLENTSELNKVEFDSGDEPISLKEILNMYEDNTQESLDIDNEMSKTTINDAYKGDFTSSPYLSPILGLEEEIEYDKSSTKSLAEIQLENTANLEKLDKEIRKTNEFLSILNDLKKNLD